MKTEELQKYIQTLGPDLYAFAYVLIPDDLQASQLMIDCVQSFLIQKKSMVERMSLKSKLAKVLFSETKFHLMKIIFVLSRRRYQQLKMSLQGVEQNGGFFALEFDEKAAIFLKDKAHFELDQIEFIMNATKAEVLAQLYSARIKLVQTMPGADKAAFTTGGSL